jgi:hypothetical protein
MKFHQKLFNSPLNRIRRFDEFLSDQETFSQDSSAPEQATTGEADSKIFSGFT